MRAGSCGLLLLAGACAARTAITPEMPRAPDCSVLPAPETAAAHALAIALPDRIEPLRAPAPGNASERLLFALLYETLVRVDCGGRVQPGLARRWSGDSGGRRWTFELREDAAFWDGAPLRARDVVSAWRSSEMAPVSVEIVSDRVLVVVLRDSEGAEPLALADPRWAIARRTQGSAWPSGTGPYQPGPTTANGRTLTLHPARAGERPPVGVRIAAGSDMRDLLDEGIDAMLTDESSVIDYAGGWPQLAAIPLPWDRTYVLLVPARAAQRGGVAPQDVEGDARALREALARDAVRGDARPSEGAFWWAALGSCTLPVPLEAAPVRTGRTPDRTRQRLVYQRGDRRARDLAERLVALSGFGDRASSESRALAAALPELAAAGSPAAIGLEGEELWRAIRSGADLAYLAAIPTRTLSPCDEMRTLIHAAGWLAPATGHLPPIFPLVDSRPHLVVRRGALGATLDWSGTPHLMRRGSSATRGERLP